ncbi:mevalonate kinase family protein [Nevskia ramosa]|uniref:mevalonate kinase family protein n=1 Tax=Nevskia ramosa TaxID=64002 RepID=UPI003D0FAD12
MNIAASAPGKLVLLGEYAVLEGAPAVAMAVDRRAVAKLTAQPGPRCEVFAPDVLKARTPFSIGSNGLPDWQAAGADAARLSLVDEVLRGLADEGLAPAAGSGFHLALDTSAFFDTQNAERPKLGLGSSAALTVALAMAFVARAGQADDAASHASWLPRLLALHRKFQGGQGSGVDVATSLIGGVIAYQLNDGGTTPSARPLTWPAGLHQRFIWSGRSASTPKFLSILRAWRLDHEAEYRTRMDALSSIASAAVEALAAADAAGFLSCASSYANDLRALGLASGVSIYSEEHVAIAAIAASHEGVVYKPCGAGGGDVGVLFATDPERLTAAVAQLAAAGFASVPLAVDVTGLRIAITESVEA